MSRSVTHLCNGNNSLKVDGASVCVEIMSKGLVQLILNTFCFLPIFFLYSYDHLSYSRKGKIMF